MDNFQDVAERDQDSDVPISILLQKPDSAKDFSTSMATDCSMCHGDLMNVFVVEVLEDVRQQTKKILDDAVSRLEQKILTTATTATASTASTTATTTAIPFPSTSLPPTIRIIPTSQIIEIAAMEHGGYFLKKDENFNDDEEEQTSDLEKRRKRDISDVDVGAADANADFFIDAADADADANADADFLIAATTDEKNVKLIKKSKINSSFTNKKDDAKTEIQTLHDDLVCVLPSFYAMDDKYKEEPLSIMEMAKDANGIAEQILKIRYQIIKNIHKTDHKIPLYALMGRYIKAYIEAGGTLLDLEKKLDMSKRSFGCYQAAYEFCSKYPLMLFYKGNWTKVQYKFKALGKLIEESGTQAQWKLPKGCPNARYIQNFIGKF